MVEKLVPEQIRGITHLCVTSRNGRFLGQPLLSKFKGLKYLDIHIVSWEDRLAQEPGIKELKNLDLRSLRFTTSPKLERDKAFVLEWIRLQETDILSKQQPMLTTG